MINQKLAYWQKGFLVGVFLPMFLVLYLFLREVAAYNGYCVELGLLFGGSSAPRTCSFWEYLTTGLGFTFDIYLIMQKLWWAFLLVILITTFIGYMLDKKRIGQASK
ncbi:MAG: hypothetical protein A3C84_05035 [Candidatus Ryanbacteria bacterium RIFCSPHIGHO2_02_FULL_48_12]|uniref:Uncharacterized protein n=1 Tax=Candidatus Ryanbacteria bacterium RIFCSPHIGHO2_01_FULL_48_27 TaxID=1802115 RepID=A0A1G2G7C2_9BACT|nr:MAG: hypothetical protein A2756_06090 [Candidatus Ryanbacteria bacterium RIFCSPHIGHO2_01_FULL_48_27]OGZ49527.1 MAG: hypothetical protein A3C84_05035 [Candidatus Ryanbacteria bacterium RIFCSPHIGHO2_02_FULL_48_12]